MPNMKLGGGGRFAKLQHDVAEGYEEKGMSHEKAMEIGAATAAKMGRKRYGAEAMAKMATAGKKKAKRY